MCPTKIEEWALSLNLINSYMATVSTCHVDGAIYRGHANAAWTLTPAAFRGLMQHGIQTSAHLSRWKEVAARFAGRPLSDLEWLVLAQHYGVGTTLLDWTTNPLVALYFACQHVSQGSLTAPPDANVHMLPGRSLSGAPTNRSWNPLEKYHGPPLLINAMGMNKRTMAQDSIMTLHQAETSIPNESFNSVIFTVPANMKRETLGALKILGVSSDRIFVDIGVVAREFAEELHQAALSEMFKSAERAITLQG